MGKEQLSINNKLYMGNLNPQASEEDVRKFLADNGFSSQSQITGFWLKKGFAVIAVANQDVQDAMIDKIHGMEFQGNKLILEPSFSGSNQRIRTTSTSSTTVTTGTENPLKILIPTEYIGAVIGRGGASIKETTKTTGARINVLRNWPLSNEKIICIIGLPENCSAACKRILELCELESKACSGGEGEGEALRKTPEVCLKIFAADSQIGRVIGREGKSIKKIMRDTQTKIHVTNQAQKDSRERDHALIGSSSSSSSSWNNLHQDEQRIIVIRGSVEGMSKAEQLISSKLQVQASPHVVSSHNNSNSNSSYAHNRYSNTDFNAIYHRGSGSNISHINSNNNTSISYNNNNPINFRDSGMTLTPGVRPMTAIPSPMDINRFYQRSPCLDSGMDLNFGGYSAYARVPRY